MNATVRTISAMIALIGAIQTNCGYAATLYSNDFDLTSLPNATAQFVLDAGNGVLNYSDTAAGASPVATASANVAGVGSPSFVVSTIFTLTEGGIDTGNLSTVGIGALGSTSTFLSSGGESYYLADWGVNSSNPNDAKGQLRILSLGDSNEFTSLGNGDTDGAGANGSSVVVGNTYELKLTGEYSGSSLNMTLALFDSAGTQLGTAATATDTSPLAGQFFGYRNRLVNTSGTTSLSYDSFRVESIPEPGSLALLFSGMLGLGAIRMRSSRLK